MRARLGFTAGLVAALAIGAFGCVNSSTSHDGAQSTTTAQTTGAALGDEGAQARSESARDVDRVVASDSDHTTRHADRGEGNCPDPVPWTPRAGSMPGPSSRPSSGGTLRIANPYNQR
ncbi:MAG: hypothetical protein ACRELY_24420 [Polyangiaceae bacterium]